MDKNYEKFARKIFDCGFVDLIGLDCRLTGLLTGRGGYFEGKNAKIAADAVREKIVKPFKITEVSIFGSIFSALKG